MLVFLLNRLPILNTRRCFDGEQNRRFSAAHLLKRTNFFSLFDRTTVVQLGNGGSGIPL